MSIIMGAIQGAGDAGQQYFASQEKMDNEVNLAKIRSDLDFNKAKLLAQNTVDLTNAPLNRMQGLISNARGQQVPVDPAPVTTASGQDPNLTNGGYQGPADQQPSQGMTNQGPNSATYSALLARAKNLPPEDQQPYIDQLNRQFGADKATAAGIVAGQTRAPTDAEAEKMALSDAATTDLPAVAAYQKSIAGPEREDRRLDQQATASQQHWDTMAQMQQLRSDAFDGRTQAMRDIAQAHMETLVAKMGSGNTDFDKKIALLRSGGATDKELADYIMERKQPSLQDIATSFLRSDPNAGTKKAMTPQAAFEMAKTVNDLSKSFKSNPAPTSSDAPAGLPPGAKQIGTSGGKAVYQLPDGSKVQEQ